MEETFYYTKEQLIEYAKQQRLLCEKSASTMLSDNGSVIINEDSIWNAPVPPLPELTNILSRNKMIKQFKELNPYPVDVFTEPTDEQWKRVAPLLQSEGIVPDRIFAKFGRMIWEGAAKRLDELLPDSGLPEKNKAVEMKLIHGGHLYSCPNCIKKGDVPINQNSNFCPNCGVKINWI